MPKGNRSNPSKKLKGAPATEEFLPPDPVLKRGSFVWSVFGTVGFDIRMSFWEWEVGSLTGTAFNTLLLTQHKEYPKVRWVICSICQQEDPDKAKREVPISGTTTPLQRHILLAHPEKFSGLKEAQMTATLQKSKSVPKKVIWV